MVQQGIEDIRILANTQSLILKYKKKYEMMMRHINVQGVANKEDSEIEIYMVLDRNNVNFQQ